MADDASAISTPKELANMIEGKSDDEITTEVRNMGPENALEKVFEGMQQAFLKDKAGSDSAVIQWNIGFDGATHTFQVKVDGGECAITKGANDTPRVTLDIDLPNFLRVITGKLNGQQAFFSGKLKLAGDMMFAMTQENWFDKNWGG